nr:uncharacterized protein LOC108175928 [Oryctolagus cuniculus]
MLKNWRKYQSNSKLCHKTDMGITAQVWGKKSTLLLDMNKIKTESPGKYQAHVSPACVQDRHMIRTNISRRLTRREWTNLRVLLNPLPLLRHRQPGPSCRCCSRLLTSLFLGPGLSTCSNEELHGAGHQEEKRETAALSTPFINLVFNSIHHFWSDYLQAPTNQKTKTKPTQGCGSRLLLGSCCLSPVGSEARRQRSGATGQLFASLLSWNLFHHSI